MTFQAVLRGERFTFSDLRDVFAKANEPKAGDYLAGIGAASETQRVAAKIVLADVRVSEVLETTFVDDDVSDLVEKRLDHSVGDFSSLTLGELRQWILSPGFASVWSSTYRRAFTPEVAAGVAKLLGDKDLILAASRLRSITKCRNTMGEVGTFGVRIQPNHPTDDVQGIVLSVIDGLRHGCGDAVIGVNPAGDAVSTIAGVLEGLQHLVRTLAIPTQTCVLAHVSTQLEAMRRGAPLDLLFQSVAGTQAANASFGVTLAMLDEGRQEVLAHHATRSDEFVGDNVMYFETGQGTALSADAHFGVDQLTLEARAQAVAAAFDPFLVNTVVGFIGPEYLSDARQITRAGLEDHFMGKLQGLPMGCDVCYTNHVDADQNSNDDLLVLLAAAGCNFVMGVPASDDVMLHYQSTSYEDAAAIREVFGTHPAPEFFTWMKERGWWHDGHAIAGLPSSADVALGVGGD